jgi:phosphoglycolate phosphatase
VNRLALFDCDGTLVDSGANICTAMTMSFADVGLPPPTDAATRRIVGLSIYEAMRALYPEGTRAHHEALGGAYRRAFTTLRAEKRIDEPLFAGIDGALDALDEAGWLLGVATGKSDFGLKLCLDHHGLAGRFVTLQTADRHPSKPDPSMALAAMAEAGAGPETSVMIGDTRFDIAMAKAAGMLAIGVAWGYHAAEELLAEGADRVARHPAELAAMLEELR